MLQGIPSIIFSKVQGYDVDAQAFLTATGITDALIKSAINTLVISAKANGWWTLCRAIYPFVGSTSTTCKYNLKDPRDLDAAFRLSFVNSPTITSDGVAWNGTSQYADTFFDPSVQLGLDSNHLSYYSRTASVGGSDMGNDNVGVAALGIIIKLSVGGNTFMGASCNLTNFGSGEFTDANTNGLFIVTRTSSGIFVFSRNGTGVDGALVPSSAYTNSNIYIGALNRTGGILYGQRQCAFASIGDTLDSTMQSTMYTDVQAFQTTLGRQV